MKNNLLLLLCTMTLLFFTGCSGETKEEFQDMTKEKCVENIATVEKIKVFDYNNEKIKTITSEEEINEFSNIILNSKEVIGDVNLEGHTGVIYMYNSSDELVCNTYAWKNGYLGFSKKITKEYEIEFDDINKFKELLTK